MRVAIGRCFGTIPANSIVFHRHGLTTYDTSATMNACLTGLVAITSPCASVEPWAAVLIGVIAGWVYLIGSRLLIRFKIDDAVDAIPVHLGGGAWGVLSAGLFTTQGLRDDAYGANPNIGWFYEWGRGSANFNLMGAQIVGVLFIFGWVAVTMGALFYILKIVGWYRISELEEHVGMDLSRHKGGAYDLSIPDKEFVDQLNVSRSRVIVPKAEKAVEDVTPEAPEDNEA